ncbi:MAG: 1-acyl-sn-glycerol-3-phosphate acyltransferase [Rhodothermales bacterium]|nr:1-acyl-sn-glycerol-3-phosphate acyltransferase [Rhodothermales bacterium]
MIAGKRALENGPCFFYGNHSNRWDPFVLNCFTPWADPTGGVMTQEFFRRPFLRWALSRFDLHPTRKRIADPHLIRVLHRMVADGRKIVIYPEGGSRWTGRPEPWIESTAKLFTRMGIPVYPVVTRGSYTTWPRWATYPRPGRVEVEILEPLSFSRNTPLDEAIRQLRAPIQFDENVAPEHLRPRWAYRPADGIHRLLYRDPVTGKHGGLGTPDGTYVQNEEGSLRLKMLPDSRLLDETTGEVHLTGDLYEKIRDMPLSKDPSGRLLENNVECHVELDFPHLVSHGDMTARLFDDSIQLNGATTRSIPLADLHGFDVERNFKLQLFLAAEMVQLSFVREGSALAWRDALARLGNASPDTA